MSDVLTTHRLARRPGFLALMFANIAAPIFWLGQLMLSYLVSSLACYGSDHPTTLASGTALQTALYAFDAVAIVAALAGGTVAFLSWRAVRDSGEESGFVAKMSQSRTRFMAQWGMMSSLWFLGAIAFNTIATATVRLCVL
jgi:hypothetical protein